MTRRANDWRALLRTPRTVDADAGWAGVEARRGRRRVLQWAVWGVSLTAAAVWALVLSRGGPAGLEREDGGSLAQLEAATQPAQFVLSDGSQIELAAGARLATRSLDAQLFATEISAGKVTFDVVPHGPRVWEVSAGSTLVRVLGTRFSVERNAAGVQVSVTRGRVLVTGPYVPGGSQQLLAGDSLQTRAQPLPAHALPQPAGSAASVVGSQPGATVGSQSGAVVGSQSGAVVGSQLGAAEWSQPGAAEGSQPGAAEGSQLGAAEGSQPGAAEGSQSGAAEGSQSGAAEGSQSTLLKPGPSAGLRSTPQRSGVAPEPQSTPARSSIPAYGRQRMLADGASDPAGPQTASQSTPHGESGPANAAAGSIELSLREADRARAQGQPERAAKLLSRVIAAHPNDARAALAAFTLGELYLGALASPLKAAETFERAQKLGLPAVLAEQGAARIFEAYGAAGQRVPAANAARAYLAAYPDGSHRRAAERLVGAP